MAKERKNNSVSEVPAPGPKTGSGSLDHAQSQMLNTQAFSNLSQKIQAQFKKLSHDTPKENSKQPKKQKTADVQKRVSKPSQEINLIKAQSRGKKRNSQGVVKEQGKTSVTQKLVKRVTATVTATVTSVLEKELYALGGTAEDLALIANLDSESELDVEDGHCKPAGATKFEKGLKQGIADIMKQIDECGRPASIESNMEGNEHEEEDEAEEVVNVPTYAAPVSEDRMVPNLRSGKSNLLIAPRPEWFNIQLPPIKKSNVSMSKILTGVVQQLHEHARSLLDIENEGFKASQQSSSSRNFYSTVIASGTLSDKISALTLAVQESPLHNIRALETLINLAKKRSRAQAVDVLRALKDLFAQGTLLPSDRKLQAFSAHPNLLSALVTCKSWKPGDALPGSLQAQHLVVWAYESWLKEEYFEVLKTLEIWCNDEIEFSKSKAVSFVYELLKEKPEQESNLLRLLTNKLGDPSKKIASQTSYLLMQLMAAHPLMKTTIISSIESDLLLRPGQSLHAKYYAAITLNQTSLSSREEEVASKILSVYFSLFVGLLKPTKDEKTVSNDDSEPRFSREGHRKPSDKDPHEAENAQAEDLREKLTSAILTGINRAYPYTDSNSHRCVRSLLLLIMHADLSVSLPTHLETLFKITHSSNFNTSIQAMMLIQQICSSHQASADRFYRTLYESLLDARLVNSSKQSLYLNLIYRALKADTNVKRVKGFAKRILQILALHQPSFICGCFFLLQELMQTFPGLGAMIDQPEEHEMADEVYEDVREADDEAPLPKESEKSHSKSQAYDSRKRDPEHSNAENSCLWEVIPFLAHFHPSVSVSAEHLIRHAKLPGKPDLELHTLIHFLDRFAYRNAKIGTSNLRGSSIMQPLAGGDTADLLCSSNSHGQLPVNSEKFRGRKSEDVPAEDAFFHQYFNSLGKSTQDRKASKKMKKSEDSDEASESEETEIWKAMMDSAPDLEGADDSDEGLEMSDLNSDFEESSDGAAEDDETDSQEIALTVDEISVSSDADLSQALVETDPASDHNSAAVDNPTGKSTVQRVHQRKLKHLPTFASASDYARMIDDEEDEDLG